MSPCCHNHGPRAAIMKAKKSKAAKEALNRLNAFLNAAEPEPVYWLTRLWNDQQSAITYKELREAIERGGLTPQTLADWQQDYANFVNERLKPIWTEAMEAGAAQLMAKHPDFFFDTLSEGVQNWTSTHGAEWITAMTDEAREAVTAMIDRASTGAWTVDELSRAIRPTVGLTKQQSLANLNHYQHVKASLLTNNQGMKQETAERMAREAAAKYAGRQHRQRAFTIATTELAFAYNKGNDDGVKQAIQQGYMGKTVRIWSTAYDDGVCEICSALEGTECGMEEEFNFKGQSLYAGQKETPPAHPRCRCAIVYEEVEPPAIYQGDPTEGAQTWADAPEAVEPPEPPEPAVANTLAVPGGMKSQGEAHLGNTGKMYFSTDADGTKWLFKPAQSKSGVPEPFRAYVQEAGYKVQSIIDPSTAVPVTIGHLDGKLGAFQTFIESNPDGFDFEAWQLSGGILPAGTASQIQREHVTDWLLGNFDAHGENFLLDKTGRLVGVDKEQAFKFIKEPGAKSMSYAYHPNKAVGETEPLYNTLYRRFAKGEIDLDLQDTLTYIKRAEAIPSAEYREIFREYAENLTGGPGKAAEELLDAIVERKETLRETYRAFYSDLLTERTGKKQTFIWADEAAQAAKQPMAAVRHSTEILKQTPVPQLKQMAKQAGIPYYNKFTKTELVTALSDPVQAAEISAKTKAKLLQLEATRPQRMAAAGITPKAPAIPKGVLKAGDVFTDLSSVPAVRVGVPIASDMGAVEGLNLTARRITVDGTELYEITGKLTEATWSKTWDELKQYGGTKPLTFELGDDTMALLSSQPVTLRANLKARSLEDAGSTVELYVHNGSEVHRAWQGFLRLRVPYTGNGAADAKAASNLLSRVGLGDLTATPTKEAEATLKKSRIIWQHAPGRSKELAGLTGADLDVKLDTILAEEGLTGRVGDLTMKKVFDGYQTLVDTKALAEYKKAGLTYVWTGVGDSGSVVNILKSSGLMSTNQRTMAGMAITGASPTDDMRGGGSDSVFTRIGVKKSGARYRSCFGGMRYRIIIDPAEMARTDWYAYECDNYGTTSEGDMAARPSAVQFIKNMTTRYREGNEIMFRHGIPKESFIGINCDSDDMRDRLLQELRDAGITEINGKSIEDFVEVRREI